MDVNAVLLFFEPPLPFGPPLDTPFPFGLWAFLVDAVTFMFMLLRCICLDLN
jgi:hypothetical protein